MKSDKIDDVKKTNINESTNADNDSNISKEPEKSKVIWFHFDFPGMEPRGMKAVYEYIKAEYVKEIIPPAVEG